MAPQKRRRTGGGGPESGGAQAAAPGPQAEAAGAGADGQGLEWSYERLWDDLEISRGWHSRNVRFWRAQAADVRGATGGGVSQRDLEFTRKAVTTLASVGQGAQRARFERALDLGAGIGRVTDAVLRHCCRHVDLVEFVQKHLCKAKERLPAAGKGGCTFTFHCCAVQKFQVPHSSYNLIWCQWLLMYLTDADALDLLRRLRPGLAEGALLLVKENISTPDELTYFDAADGELWADGSAGGPVSCVRTELHYEDLFERAGLKIKEQKLQRDATGKTMDMMLYALVPLAERTA